MRSNRVIVGFVTSLLLAAGIAGCTANKEIEKFADKACACADKECATNVANEVADWLLKNQNARGDEDKAKQDFERMGKCFAEKGADLSKFMEAAQKVSQ
jgi:hypothetical protein